MKKCKILLKNEFCLNEEKKKKALRSNITPNREFGAVLISAALERVVPALYG